ncbi:hypothetical protein NEOLEDRAFT_403408 [Neolentinus lepideus HHB14362 ss-1]|uniref:Uncharacterized protein n=1 Tax=Neolentinus lepideus HHB14362 ss-1 TaxID=1314782 RepID=A0A165S3C5_9AGAM|nr:hypothetical protein NEOLEDRAFT_403408 [Neolentinus lepideus HHB14362 ss-1]
MTQYLAFCSCERQMSGRIPLVAYTDSQLSMAGSVAYLRLPSRSRGLFEDHTRENDNCSLIAVSIASNSTSPENVGPGRTLDTVISMLGQHVTSFLSHVSERRLRKGPNVLVGRMLGTLDWTNCSCESVWCRKLSGGKQHSPVDLTSDAPSLQQISEALYASTCSSCRTKYAESLLRSPVFRRGCRKLLKQLRSGSKSVQLLAAYYILALACFHPLLLQVFVANDAMNIVNYILSSSRFFSNDALSAPLAPLERALASESENGVLSTIKDSESLLAKMLQGYYYEANMSEREVTNLLPYMTKFNWSLLRDLRNSQSQLLVASVFPLPQVSDWASPLVNIPAFKRNLDAQTIISLWTLLYTSVDPVVRAIIGSFIRNIYSFAARNVYCDNDLIGQGSSILWYWRCFWMPLLRLRYDI